MKLPDRLFHPGRTVRARILPPESRHPNLSLPDRIVATSLAAIWLCAGLAMIVLCVRNGKWLLSLLGISGAWYGMAWARVAHEARLPGGRLRLNPWARG